MRDWGSEGLEGLAYPGMISWEGTFRPVLFTGRSVARCLRCTSACARQMMVHLVWERFWTRASCTSVSDGFPLYLRFEAASPIRLAVILPNHFILPSHLSLAASPVEYYS